jgi:hypothetical protein
MSLEFLLDAEAGKEFSDVLFQMVFGRTPDYRYDRQFLTRYLLSIPKTREEIINGYIQRGSYKE